MKQIQRMLQICFQLKYIRLKVIDSSIISKKSTTTEFWSASGKSFIMIRNSKGPKMEPWGTPQVTLAGFERVLFEETR